MPRLLLFNPENDIALASASANFTAPKAAVDLRNAGSALPFWYADSGDRVLCHGIDARWLDLCRERFGIDADVYDHSSSHGLVPSPWGWSATTKREFLTESISQDALPSDSIIGQWRMLSHRRTASKLREAIAPELDFDIAPAAVEISDTGSLVRYLASQPESIIKSPWSSSGRGLTDTRRLRTDEVIRRAEGIIRRQGSVMVEQAYRRTADFAMLFFCKDGKCEFSGYSFFKTDAAGNYTGNVLADETQILEMIGRHYPADRIIKVAESVRKFIASEIASIYDGPLGVDMLTARCDDGSVMLDASVELNLRMTMGFVALSLSRRYLAPGSIGAYSVIRADSTTSAADDIITDSGRIVSGRMMLTPPGGRFRFAVSAAPCDSSHCNFF